MKSKSFLGHFKRKRKKKQKIDLVVYERSAACICWIRFNLTFLQKENATCVFPCFSRVVFWLASFIQWRLDGRVSYFVFLASNPPYISTAHCTQTITLYRLLLHFSFLFYHFPSFGHSFVFFFSSLQKSSFFFFIVFYLPSWILPAHTHIHTHTQNIYRLPVL